MRRPYPILALPDKWTNGLGARLQSVRPHADPRAMSLLARRLPALLGALILFALVITAAADARPLVGSPGADRLTVKTAVGNVVRASGGNDRVVGGDGPDQLYGETGGDALSGRGGDDLLDGGSGDDTLNGESGNDTEAGGFGHDRLDGGGGDDMLGPRAPPHGGGSGAGNDAGPRGPGRAAHTPGPRA